MNDLPRHILQRLIKDYGPALWEEPRLCRNLLRDLCGEYRREIHVLIVALEERMVLALRTDETAGPKELILERLVIRLRSTTALGYADARWAIETWALALGVLSVGELSASHSSPADEIFFEDGVEGGEAGLTEPPLTVYELVQNKSPTRTPNLRLKRNLSDYPEKPFWYQNVVDRLREYIAGANGKPVLLTGYDSFGGTSLVRWAINEAAKDLVDKTGGGLGEVIIPMEVNLVGTNYDGFWIAVRNWFDHVYESDDHKRFKKRLGSFFESVKQDLYFQLSERKTVIKTTDSGLGVGIEIPKLVKAEHKSRGQEITQEELRVPRDPKTPVEQQRLLALSRLLPKLQQKPVGRWGRWLRLLRGDGRPYRIVLILDKVESGDLLKELDPLLRTQGGLRIITVMDRYDYDAWAYKNPNAENLLAEKLEIIKCRPIWDEDICRKLYGYYFEGSSYDLRKKAIRDFVDGLNFGCCGSPGNFKRFIEKHWQIDGREVVLNSEMMPSCQVWARIGRALKKKKQWKSIIGGHDPIVSPDHPAAGEHQLRARLFLYLIAKRAIDIGRQPFTQGQFLRVCREETAKINLEINEHTLQNVSSKLIGVLLAEGVLKSSVQNPRRGMGKRPGRALSKRPLHLIWIVDCSGSMAEDGKTQALNNAIRETISHMRDAARENPNAEVLLRAVTFSSGARWHVEEPTPIAELRWQDVCAGGARDMGQALRLVAEELKCPPMPERALPPVLILVTDGAPTDDFAGGLKVLMSQPWGRKAVRLAAGVGEGADQDVLMQFIGRGEIRPLRLNSPEALARYVKWVSTTTAQAEDV